MNNRHSKLLIALQNYLCGAKYYDALKAFDFAKKIHIGTRKDGITPEFQHQLEIALFITTLRDLDDEEGTIIGALLHDVLEDYPFVTTQQLIDLIGTDRIQPIILVSKYINGQQTYKFEQEYFHRISQDPIASIIKGSDRIHNLRTMHDAFTLVKQEQYVYETQTFFLPMLKVACGQFPTQYLAYMNIRTMIKTQLELIQAALKAHNIEKTK